MSPLLPIILKLAWSYDLEAHPNYPEYPVTSYHVQSVDCGSKYHGTTIPPVWQTWWDYFSVESFPNDIPFIAEPSVVWEIPVQEWLRQFTAYPEYCHDDAGEIHSGVYVWVAPSDNTGEGPPSKAWWINIWGADVNHNGQIDSIDFLHFARCYANGSPAAVVPGNEPMTCESSDVNNSGAVDAMDFLLWSGSANGLQPNLVWEVPLSSFNRDCHPSGPGCP